MINAENEGPRTSSLLPVVTSCVAGVVLLVLYRAQIVDIFVMALRTTDRGYVFLVPAVAAYLMVIRRSRLRRMPAGRQGASLGILLVGGSFFLSWFGKDRDLLAIWQLAPVVGVLGICIAALGMRRVAALGPGFMILPLLVPIPGGVRQALAQPLQLMATEVTSFVLQLLGVNAVRTGSLIDINGALVAVGEACNGMRLILPLAIVMYAFVFSLPLRWMTRGVLLFLCIPVALVCNVVRLVPTALAYGYLPEHAVVIHDLGGWLMIPLALLMLVGFLRMLAWMDISVSRYRLVTA